MARLTNINTLSAPPGRAGRRQVLVLLPTLALLAMFPWRGGLAAAGRPRAGGDVVLIGGWILDRRDIPALHDGPPPTHAG